MHWPDFALLDDAGFSLYEKRALVTLARLGVADAATLCREGEVPTSKIYLAMEKLTRLGLAEAQATRPKLYSALPSDLVVDRLVEVARDRAELFAERAPTLRQALARLPGRLRGRQAFVDMALGMESHVKRHVARLGSARERVLSYMEEGDLVAIERVAAEGWDVVRRIARNAQMRKIDHRVVFGFSDRTAARLIEFLGAHGPALGHLSGVRYSGELGHPFHVVDGETVILALDHPFVPEGRFASLLVRDRGLADSLSAGFETLWQKALRDLREIRFHPRRDRRS
ncbi:MAG: TrmB family transcriptional regulator [Thermoanaerobaculia bacterium]